MKGVVGIYLMLQFLIVLQFKICRPFATAHVWDWCWTWGQGWWGEYIYLCEAYFCTCYEVNISVSVRHISVLVKRWIYLSLWGIFLYLLRGEYICLCWAYFCTCYEVNICLFLAYFCTCYEVNTCISISVRHISVLVTRWIYLSLLGI
jgi:hypothetical protein